MTLFSLASLTNRYLARSHRFMQLPTLTCRCTTVRSLHALTILHAVRFTLRRHSIPVAARTKIICCVPAGKINSVNIMEHLLGQIANP